MFSKDKMKEQANEVLDQAGDISKEAKKSGQDWLNYIMEHPAQSLLFGTIIGLAIRGLFKK